MRSADNVNMGESLFDRSLDKYFDDPAFAFDVLLHASVKCTIDLHVFFLELFNFWFFGFQFSPYADLSSFAVFLSAKTARIVLRMD